MIEESYKLAVRIMKKEHEGFVHTGYQFYIIKKEKDYILDTHTFSSAVLGKAFSYIHNKENQFFSSLRIIKKILTDFKKISNISDCLYFDKKDLRALFHGTLPEIKSEIESRKPIFFIFESLNNRDHDEEEAEFLEKYDLPENKVNFLISLREEMKEIVLTETGSLSVKQRDLTYMHCFDNVDESLVPKINEVISFHKKMSAPVVEKEEEEIIEPIDEDKLNAIKALQCKSLEKRFNKINNPTHHKLGYVEEVVYSGDIEKVYNIYTDASINEKENYAGYGIIITDGKNKKVLSKKAGAFKLSGKNKGAIQLAEMKAIFEAINYVFDSEGDKHKDCQVNLYTDSKDSVIFLRSVYSKRTKWTGNFKGIKRMVDEIKGKKMNVNFMFIKGHNGHKFNSMADTIAGWSAKEKLSTNIVDVDFNSDAGKVNLGILGE